MGVRFVCDGCGDMMGPGAEPKRLGKVIRREYCGRCVDVASAYLDEVDRLHDDIAKRWEIDAGLLRLKAHVAGLILLPDSASRPQERDRDHEVEESA